jgi:group I intron endonuclease
MIIYRITNLVNGKVYIGQTSQSLHARFVQHINNNYSVSAIAAAIHKYGAEQFKIEQLATADNKEQLDELEKVYIKLNNSMAPHGYNLKDGGTMGSTYTEESKNRMSLAKIGKIASIETRRKMSVVHTERWKNDEELHKRKSQTSKALWENPEYRDGLIAQRKDYWSRSENREQAAERGRNMISNEYLEKVSLGVRLAQQRPDVKEKMKKFYETQQKPVVASDGREFASLAIAAATVGCHESSIVKCIKGQYKSAGKLTWQYKDDQLVSSINIVEDMSKVRPTITLLIGAPSAGKSWVANQLLDSYDYISYDHNRKNTHLDLLAAPSDKPKLYDPTFKIGTVIRRHSDQFNFVIVCIQESEAVLRERMVLRGGEWTDTIMKRSEQVRKRFEKYGNGGFIGTAQECLDYLRQRIQSPV